MRILSRIFAHSSQNKLLRVITYYRECKKASPAPVRGGLYWTYFQLAYNGPIVERAHRDGRGIERLDVSKHDPNAGVPDSFDKTASNEFLAIQSFKHRLVVVLSTPGGPSTDESVWRTGEHVLIAPVYTIYDRHQRKHKCTPEFLGKVIRYEYASLFFLPGHRRFRILPSVVRLDHAQPIHISWLSQDKAMACLTEDALTAIEEWFFYYLTGRMSKRFAEDIQEYRIIVEEDGLIETSPSYDAESLYDSSP